MNDRSLLSFIATSKNQEFNVYLPKSGDPATVARLMKDAVAPGLPMDMGEMACRLVYSASEIERPRLRADDDLADADFYYIFASDGSSGVYRVLGGEAERLFSGRIADFIAWAENLTGLEDTVGKVVQFAYDGGSEPGAKRTVRVEKITREASRVWVEGLDLAVPDLSRARRRYDEAKITGEISLLN